MFGGRSVVLFLAFQIAEATVDVDSLASSPTAPGQPQRLKQSVRGELQMTSISWRVADDLYFEETLHTCAGIAPECNDLVAAWRAAVHAIGIALKRKASEILLMGATLPSNSDTIPSIAVPF